MVAMTLPPRSSTARSRGKVGKNERPLTWITNRIGVTMRMYAATPSSAASDGIAMRSNCRRDVRLITPRIPSTTSM